MIKNPVIFLSFAICILGCTEEKTATVSGNLDNITDKSISISIGADPRTGLKTMNNAIQSEIQEDGSFSFSVEVTSPIQLTLVSENYNFISNVYLMSGGETYITADCDNTTETIEYSGDNGAMNNFYFKWARFYNNTIRELNTGERTYDQWIQSLDSLEDISSKMLQKYIQDNSLNKDEKYWLTSKVKYRKYSNLLSRAYTLESKPADRDFSFFQTLNLNDDRSSKINKSYNRLTQRYILHLVNASGIYHDPASDNSEFYEARYNTAIVELTGKVRDVVLNILVTDLLSRNETCASEYYQRFLVDCQSRELRKIATALYNEHIGLVGTGFDSGVEFVLTDNRAPLEVLSRFENKVVYLDFWASWCSPCLGSIPQTMDLADHYQNEDVEVLYVGHRDQRSSLESAIKKHKILGKHIILDEKETELWKKEFEVGGIPSYILLDRNQKVVEFDAPHPDEPLVFTMIDSLLLEK
jgi:thiol-disulfide isomerase/thioredoxin